MSRTGPSREELLEELRELRTEVHQLAERVQRATELVFEFLDSPPRAFSDFERVSSAGSGGPIAEPESTPAHAWADREEVVRGIGAFFLRALRGEHPGNSGRSRISFSSRIYVVVRDKTGQVARSPVRVFNRFAEVKALCAYGKNFGDSIFCGFPSLREARLACDSAGLQWPPEQ